MKKGSDYNYWDIKPWWCKPWTIILFGLLSITTSWYIFTNLILSIFLSLVIIIWWILFLLIAPKLYKEELMSNE